MAKDDRETHINNHFIQKAYIKNFTDQNNWYKWFIFDGEEVPERYGYNSIDDKVQYKAFSVDYYYSQKIEIAMNDIETESMMYINKIIENFKTNNRHIELDYKEVSVIKCYIALSIIRTQSFRNFLKENTFRDKYEREIDNSVISDKDSQEIMIKMILEKFNSETNRYRGVSEDECNNSFAKFDTNNVFQFDEDQYDLKKNAIEELIGQLYTAIDKSEVIFIRFDKPKTFLGGKVVYWYSTTKESLISFFALSPNLVLSLYVPSDKAIQASHDKCPIFPSNLIALGPMIWNKRAKEVIEIQNKYKSSKNSKAIDTRFWDEDEIKKMDEIKKGDIYKFTIVEGTDSGQQVLNWLILNESHGEVILFQEIEDVKEIIEESENI